jgi:prepilin-type N-terminal cleavage/methylation domain-containing protein
MIKLTGIKPHHNNRLTRISRPAKQRGISLIEMAVVLAIIGLLMMSLWPMIQQLQYRHQALLHERNLTLVEDHLLFHLSQHGFLPCPSLNPASAEARELDGRCQLQLGYIPSWQLGLPSTLTIWYAVPASTRQGPLLRNPSSSASFWSNQTCSDQPQHHCFNRSTPNNPLDSEEGYRIQRGANQMSQGQLIWLGNPAEDICALANWPARQACLMDQNLIKLPDGTLNWRSIHTMQLLQATGHLSPSHLTH